MPTLRIYCLGNLRVELNGKIISNFETDKTRALLVYLALESGKPLQRSHLAGLLWSEETEERALHNLRQTLSYLRKVLGDPCSSPYFLLADRETIQLNPSADVWVDTGGFTQYLACAYRYYQRQIGFGLLNIRCLQKALDLYQGQFLVQFYLSKCSLFEEWSLLKREEYNLQAIKALALLAEYHERRAEYHLAIQAASRIIELAPWDETARCQVIRLLGIDRQWSAAKSQFFALKKYLAESLYVAPSAETMKLYDQICKAAAGDLPIPSCFPPEKHYFPEISSPFVGREIELDEVMERIVSPENRLITLLGPGGIGKSRFALEIAHQLVGVLPDGVFFVSLAAAQAPAQIHSFIAEATGFVFSEQLDPDKQLFDHLRNKELLLVLDNFEHLLPDPESTRILDKILTRAPRVTFLVTSREQLYLQQEFIYTLAGLDYPQDSNIPIETIDSYDALKLFTRCAAQKQRKFILDEDNLPFVIRICRILEGLPLGVELAAAAVREQGFEAIAERIENDLDVLTANFTNIQPRHRSLCAAFDVSWDLLSPHYQGILCRLSVFPDGFDRRAAQEIANASPANLAAFVSKSLIREEENQRFSFHEAIRHFVSRKLITSGYLPEIRERHAQFYVSFLKEKKVVLKGSEQTSALKAMQQEYGNLRLMWDWLVDNKRAKEIFESMESIYQYFSIQSLFKEGIQWIEQAVQSIQAEDLVLGMLLSRLGSLAYLSRESKLAFDALLHSQEILIREDALQELAFCRVQLGWVSLREKDFLAALEYVQQSLSYYQSEKDDLGELQALSLLGSIWSKQGNNQEAKTVFDKALILCRRTENPRLMVTILNRLGDLACYDGQYEIAVAQFNECLGITQRLNDRYNQAILLNNLGTIYHVWKDYPRAQEYYQNSLEICSEIGDQDGKALALNNLGELATLQGDYPAAIQHSKNALQIAEQLQEYWTIIVCLNSLGEIHCKMGTLEKSRDYLLHAIELAVNINALDLVARVSVNAGRVFQLLGDQKKAIALLQASLAHSATEYDSRAKAVDFLKEMNAVYEIENNDLTLVELVKGSLDLV